MPRNPFNLSRIPLKGPILVFIAIMFIPIGINFALGEEISEKYFTAYLPGPYCVYATRDHSKYANSHASAPCGMVKIRNGSDYHYFISEHQFTVWMPGRVEIPTPVPDGTFYLAPHFPSSFIGALLGALALATFTRMRNNYKGNS